MRWRGHAEGDLDAVVTQALAVHARADARVAAGRPCPARAHRRGGGGREIGYLLAEPADVKVTTANVDDEIARIAGPQLVVPLLNARYALNAANARWGSLYDALYGTDVDPPRRTAPTATATTRCAARGDRPWRRVPRRARPARRGLARRRDGVRGRTATRLAVPLKDGDGPARRPGAVRVTGATPAAPAPCCCEHNGLHWRSRSTARTPIGADDPAGVSDVVLEAAVSTIMDLEDSVAAVDAEDKVVGYRNWLGLMHGTSDRAVREGRPDLHAPAEPRPHATRAPPAAR